MAKVFDADACTEFELYSYLHMLTLRDWRDHHDEEDGRSELESESHKELHRLINEASSKTSRFGVETLINADGWTPNITAWFRWWKGWHDGMTGDEWGALEERIKAGEMLESDRPTGSWRDLVPEIEQQARRAADMIAAMT